MTEALELEIQMVEAAADHDWYRGEFCSTTTLAVTMGPQDSPTERSPTFVCVEMVKEEFGRGCRWFCPTKKVLVAEEVYVTWLESRAGYHLYYHPLVFQQRVTR